MANYQLFIDTGILEIPNVVPLNHCKEVSKSLIDITLKIIFQNEDISTVPDELKTQLLTDKNLREKYLDNPKCVWKDNNPMKPRVSKNTGMVDIHFDPLVKKYITFNPIMYSHIKTLYDLLTNRKDELCYKDGPDRIGIKPKGSVDMPHHLDINLFRDYPTPHRVQAFIVMQIDEEQKARDSGTIEVIKYFHKYIHLASYFFKGKLPDTGSIPQQLPKNIFDLKALNSWLKEVVYTRNTDDEKLLELIDSKELPKERIELKWESIGMKTGSLFCFDQRTPHHNLRNKSDIERIVTYIRLYPHRYVSDPSVIKDYYLHPEKYDTRRYNNSEEVVYFKNNLSERTKVDETDETVKKCLIIKS